MPGMGARSSAGMPQKKRKRKQQRESAPPPLPAELDDDDDVCEEDVEFFSRHRKFAGFLANIDAKKIDRQVMGTNDVEAYYERRPRKLERQDDDDDDDADNEGKEERDARRRQAAAAEAALDALPVKSLDGKLMLRMYGAAHVEKKEEKTPDEQPVLTKENRREIVKAKSAGRPVASKLEANKKDMGEKEEEEEDDDDDEDSDEEDGSGDGEVVGKKPVADEGVGGGAGDGKLSKKKLKRQQRLLQKDVVKKQRDSKQAESKMLAARREELEALTKFSTVQERREHLRLRMAEVATVILSDPEGKIIFLKELVDLCDDSDVAVAQLAMLSLAAVFKDIIPGYRIRTPTEAELAIKVSKEVQALRDYELTLLQTYQKFVPLLVRKTRRAEVRRAAVRCLCLLLASVPHFNLWENVLRAVIPRMDSADNECSAMCCNSVKEVFKSEGKHNGEVTVMAVEIIADFVRQRRCRLRPEVIEVFEVLRFDDNSGPRRNDRMLKKKGFTYNKAEKRAQKKIITEGKLEKQKLAEELTKEVEQHFREAQAVMSPEDRVRVQTQTLSAVFETYFRVLKTSAAPATDMKKSNDIFMPLPEGSGATRLGPRPLLVPALRGLAEFSNLISIDFMGDLLEALRRLALLEVVNNEGHPVKLGVEEQLQCCMVAFCVVKSNLSALTVDLRDFYVRFYQLLIEIPVVSRAMGSRVGEVLASAMEMMLWEGRQHDQLRVAAFAKRLSSSAMHLVSGEAMSILVTVQRILQRNSRCRAHLLENDGGGGAVAGGPAIYQPEALDPEGSGALSTCLWELTLLGRHYHPGVSQLALSLADMANGGGGPENNMATFIMRPSEALAAFNTDQGGFRPAIQSPKQILKKGGPVAPLKAAASRRGSVAMDIRLTSTDLPTSKLLLEECQEFLSLSSAKLPPKKLTRAAARTERRKRTASRLEGHPPDGNPPENTEDREEDKVVNSMKCWFREMRDFRDHQNLRTELSRVVRFSNVMRDRFEDRGKKQREQKREGEDEERKRPNTKKKKNKNKEKNSQSKGVPVTRGSH